MAPQHSCDLSHEEKLHTQGDFLRLKRNGRKTHGRMMTYVVCPNDIEIARLGIIVTRKTGNAVTRNKWKRVLREYFRTHKPLFEKQKDHLWIVKPSFQGKPPTKIRNEIEYLMKKANL